MQSEFRASGSCLALRGLRRCGVLAAGRSFGTTIRQHDSQSQDLRAQLGLPSLLAARRRHDPLCADEFRTASPASAVFRSMRFHRSRAMKARSPSASEMRLPNRPNWTFMSAAGGELEQIQFLLGHVSVQTTERYLGWLYFAGFKEHYSLFAASGTFFAALEDDLKGYELRKGTVHFPLTKPVPVKLIGRIAKLRAAGIAATPKKPLLGREKEGRKSAQ